MFSRRLAAQRQIRFRVPVSERLNKLLRQRALLQEHLAWLDEEIAAESPSSARAPANKPRPADLTMPPIPLGRAVDRATAARVEAETDALLARHQDEANTLKNKLRLGCFMYFGIALLLLAAAVTGLYFYTRSRQ